MRECAVLYSADTNTWSVIFKDDYDKEWAVEASGLSEYVARAAVKGLES